MPIEFFQLLFLLWILSGLWFIGQFLRVLFSAKNRGEISRHRRLLFWGVYIVLSGLIFSAAVVPSVMPPAWWDRIGQRKKVLERVRSAGGWDKVRLGCEDLIEKHPDGFQEFYPAAGYVKNFDYGPLPPALATLRPKGVRFYPPRSVTPRADRSEVAVVHIWIFGMHRSLGHSEPHYSLELPCGKGAEMYQPTPSSYLSFEKLTNGVFEIYR